MTKELPTHEKLHELFEYRDGILYWKVSRSPKIKVGQAAGWKSAHGYYYVSIMGKCYLRHRVVYKMFYPRMEENLLIDHKNRKRGDDRVENLHLVTPSQNNKNQKRSIKNKSGVTGVCFDSFSQSWRPYINSEGKRKYFGRFRDKEKAIEVRKEAEKKLSFSSNHGNV